MQLDTCILALDERQDDLEWVTWHKMVQYSTSYYTTDLIIRKRCMRSFPMRGPGLGNTRRSRTSCMTSMAIA